MRSWIERFRLVNNYLDPGVDLLVRSWIERTIIQIHIRIFSSTSLWGRELKDDTIRSRFCLIISRPPCEVVNWKVKGVQSVTKVTVSTSLWGRELKDNIDAHATASRNVDLLVRSWIERTGSSGRSTWMSRRPPCEVVNWKIQRVWKEINQRCRPPCEVVNWKKLCAVAE